RDRLLRRHLLRPAPAGALCRPCTDRLLGRPARAPGGRSGPPDDRPQVPVTAPASLRVALGQLSSTADPGANLLLVEREVARAAAARARLLVLPEATMCRFGVPLRPVAEPLDGPWATRVRELAAGAGL